MTVLPVEAKLFRASQQAYDIVAPGPLAVRTPFDQIGWLQPPQAFSSGLAQIDAALVGETATEAIVAFRGTLPPWSTPPDTRKVILDWLGDLDAVLLNSPDLPGLVHQGFLGALDALWSGVAASVAAGKPVFITGHSKGGALANLAAARWAAQTPARPPVVVTFAAAKPGDADFHKGYDQLVPQSARYEYRNDIVPHLPPSLKFRLMLGDLDLFAAAVARAESHLPVGVDGFEGVGTLRYIESSGQIVGDSAMLRLQRYLALAEQLWDPIYLALDHSLSDAGGYGRAVLPVLTPPLLVQASPGVSKVEVA